jgi:hypothetical protein
MLRPATFGTLRIHTARLRQWAEAAECGVRRAKSFCELRAERAGRQAKELLDWIASSKPNYNTLQKHFPQMALRLSKDTRNFCVCGIPQPSKHFEFTLQSCVSGQKLPSAARGHATFLSEPRGERGKGKRRS